MGVLEFKEFVAMLPRMASAACASVRLSKAELWLFRTSIWYKESND
jgi:hypothetical protein